MRSLVIFLAIVFYCFPVTGQLIKEQAIHVQIGYGLSAPYNSLDDIVDDGFFAQGEWVLSAASWAEIRPYMGFIWTNSNGRDLDGDPTVERAETRAFLLGGKARVRAPIRWVAPYVEIGIGGSVGQFETFTAFDAIDKRGIIYHIPVAFGLEIGRNNDVDLGFAYYFQPTVQQFAGAFALGVTFPLNQ